MLKNYLTIAWRNLIKNRTFSLINVFGLAIGITCSSLLYWFIIDELSQDNFHQYSDRLVRVVEVDQSEEQTRFYGQTAPPVGEALLQEYGEVVSYTRLFRPYGHINTEINGQRIHERNYYLVDSNFLEVFDFKLVEGDLKTPLSSPNSVVLSVDAAKKYFGEHSAIGEVLDLQNLEDAKVTAIVENPPANSHLQFDFLLTINNSDSLFAAYNQNWEAYGAYLYLLLQDANSQASLQSKSSQFANLHWPDTPSRQDLIFQNIGDIYLESESVEFGTERLKGEIRYIYLFGAIALFMLVIACINYINLATAKSGQRSREIGIRKVSGAERRQLVFQFLSESLVIAFTAMLISLGLMKLLLPYFNRLTGKNYQLDMAHLGEMMVVLLVLAVVIGLLSGLYPAIQLSRLKPIATVKGERGAGAGNLLLRQFLVVTQFTLSIIMIIATIVTSNQMNYIRERNLGFDQEAMAVVDINNGNVRSHFEAMKREFRQIAGVEKVAASSRVPGEWKDIIQIPVTSDKLAGDSVQAYFMSFDEDMVDTYNMELMEGQNFTGDRLRDSTTVLINEQAARALGWDQAINKDLTVLGLGEYRVAGVIKGFHYQSLHEIISPLVIAPWSNAVQSVDYFSLKLTGNDIPTTVKSINEVHEKYDNTTVMELHFLDQQLDRFYKADQRAQRLFRIGAVLTIFIACLGLFGLASYIIEKRTKELSIRKVLGATLTNLLIHVSGSFFKQILIAFVIAVPVAWWAMNNWLNYFAFRVSLGAAEFMGALLLVMLVGIITIGHKAIKAALINPSETLKSE